VYHKEANQTRDFRKKNPGVDGAISDPPPDMKLKPPMTGELDKSMTGRNQQYGNFLANWNDPRNKDAAREGNRGNVIQDSRGNSLSRGDYGKGMNPNYTGDLAKKSHGDIMKSKAPRY